MTHDSKSRNPHLILASSSPRRKDLLTALGIRFQIVPSTVEEAALNGESPEGQVSRLALAKAEDVMEQFPGSWVLGGDTIVVIDGRILGKPRDKEDAKSMLATLAAKMHEVYTGYALVNSLFPERRRLRYVRSGVHIRELSKKKSKGTL